MSVNMPNLEPESLMGLVYLNIPAAMAVPPVMQPVPVRRVHLDTREKPIVFVKGPEGS
jgi:hypothetical protein